MKLDICSAQILGGANVIIAIFAVDIATVALEGVGNNHDKADGQVESANRMNSTYLAFSLISFNIVKSRYM